MAHGPEVLSRGADGLTAEQTEGLLEFMEENLVSLKTTPQYRSKRLWSQCAKKLNSYPDAAKKTSSQWARFWSDLKKQVGKKAAKVKAAEDQGLVPPSDAKLTMTETRIWSLIKMADRIGVVRGSAPILATEGILDSDMNGPSNQENVRITRSRTMQTTPQVKQKGVRKAPVKSRMGKDVAVAKLHECLQSSRYRDRSRRKRVDDYADVCTESDIEDNLSALLELEKRKLEDAVRLNEAVRGIREHFSDMYEQFGELRDGILASIYTR
ncbi:hypothetical protein NE865_07008 [Phthorimaea operculella]|nr:hypothetical protein NE865_07008 [Phthorimaea operculella]